MCLVPLCGPIQLLRYRNVTLQLRHLCSHSLIHFLGLTSNINVHRHLSGIHFPDQRLSALLLSRRVTRLLWCGESNRGPHRCLTIALLSLPRTLPPPIRASGPSSRPDVIWIGLCASWKMCASRVTLIVSGHNGDWSQSVLHLYRKCVVLDHSRFCPYGDQRWPSISKDR